jgi:hypothetical protein
MLVSRFATRESVEWALQQLFYSQNEYRRAYQGLAVRFRNEGINVDGWKANLNYNLKGMFGNPQVSWQYNGPDQSGSYGMSGPERTFTGAITYNNLRTAPRGPIPNTILSNAGA